MPHDGRILIFNMPVLDGKNHICYCTSEVIPLDPERSRLELHGAPGTQGKIVFSEPCTVCLNGSPVPLSKEKEGFALLYEHTREACLISIYE